MILHYSSKPREFGTEKQKDRILEAETAAEAMEEYSLCAYSSSLDQPRASSPHRLGWPCNINYQSRKHTIVFPTSQSWERVSFDVPFFKMTLEGVKMTKKQAAQKTMSFFSVHKLSFICLSLSIIYNLRWSLLFLFFTLIKTIQFGAAEMTP